MKLVILDRDGVINQDSDAYVKSVEEFQLIEGSVEAIASLSQAGFAVAIATNQSGLARGYFELEDLEAMHQKLQTAVEAAGGQLSGIFYCPHGPDDGCDCRKPLPGLIDAIEAELNTTAAGWPMVGDSLRDLQAGFARGCKPVLVRTGKGAKTEAKLAEHPEMGTAVFDNLAQASTYILENF
ncbi:MAG: D-glycero-beta-D-manno-heptose 1,7-bisphosphate 7-phosphatase [Pseudomonadota bacterium]|nr:D-glycero-beta-D-manno-heptose 1,7-bisphosphate 7-phosphatase [Pseudomonadota bacterium]